MRGGDHQRDVRLEKGGLYLNFFFMTVSFGGGGVGGSEAGGFFISISCSTESLSVSSTKTY